MKFRSKFKTKNRQAGMEAIDTYVRGEPSESPIFLESIKKEDLVAAEISSRAAVLTNPYNPFVRQLWLYDASLARDAAYARQRRTRLKATGLGGLYKENYGGAKIAHDSQQSG